MSLNFDLQKIKNSVNAGGEIVILDEISSTQEYLKTHASDNVFCVIAKSQTAGKGTNNRKFFSPSGGIYLSVLIKNLNLKDLSYLTPYAAVVVLNAIEKSCKVNAKIKWVNDVYLKDKKLSGILTETSISGNVLDYAIVGIGINVEKQNYPNFIENVPISLKDECESVDETDIVIKILNGFLNIDKAFNDKEFMKVYSEKSAIVGKSVTVVRGSEKFSGVVTGISLQGELILNVLGKEYRFVSGEAKIEK